MATVKRHFKEPLGESGLKALLRASQGAGRLRMGPLPLGGTFSCPGLLASLIPTAFAQENFPRLLRPACVCLRIIKADSSQRISLLRMIPK